MHDGVMKSVRIGVRMYDCIARRLTVVALAVFLAAACNGSAGNGSAVITVVGTAAKGTYGERQWLKFRDRLLGASEEHQVRLLIFGEVGSEEQQLAAIRRGRAQIANVSAISVSSLVPELAILYAPYLFSSLKEADYVFDLYLTEFCRELLAENGLHLISWYEVGFHHVFGKMPFADVEEARGVRFRVSHGAAVRIFAEAIGADVIPLGFSELIPALQTGLVEAGEAAVSVYARAGLPGQAPYLTLTSHAFGVTVVVAQKAWWNSLDEGSRKRITAAYPTIQETRVAIRAEAQATLANASASGIKVVAPDSRQAERWRTSTRGTHERLLEEVGGRAHALYALIQQGRQEFQALADP